MDKQDKICLSIVVYAPSQSASLKGASLELLKIRGDVLLFKYFVSELKPGRMGNS